MHSDPFELTVYMYHYVRDPGDEAENGTGIPGLPVAQFEAHLDHVTRHYTPIAWPYLLACLQSRQSLPPAACLLTFDDGVRDHYFNVYPMLRARRLSGVFFGLARGAGDGLTLAHRIHFLLAVLGLDGLRAAFWQRLDAMQRATFEQAEHNYRLRHRWPAPGSEVNVLKSILQRDFSVPAEIILRDLFEQHVGSETQIAQAFYLTPDQILEMSRGGMHFGGHSHSHPWFDFITPAEQEREIAASAAWLRSIEPGPWAFAYPYGGLSAEAPGYLQAHGFAAAFTTVEQVRHTDRYFVGRLDGEEYRDV